MSLCEFEVSETCEMRGAVRADVAVLGVGVMQSAGFLEKSTDFCRIRSDSANQMSKMRLLEVPNNMFFAKIFDFNRCKTVDILFVATKSQLKRVVMIKNFSGTNIRLVRKLQIRQNGEIAIASI